MWNAALTACANTLVSGTADIQLRSGGAVVLLASDVVLGLCLFPAGLCMGWCIYKKWRRCNRDCLYIRKLRQTVYKTWDKYRLCTDRTGRVQVCPDFRVER